MLRDPTDKCARCGHKRGYHPSRMTDCYFLRGDDEPDEGWCPCPGFLEADE